MSLEKASPKQYIDPVALSAFREIFWRKCKEKDITLEDLADRTGLSYIQIYRIVRGKKNTSFSNVIAVIRAAEFQPVEILDFEIEIPVYPPLRGKKVNEDGKKLRKSPGPSFFINEYIENGIFDDNGLTAAELTKLVNDDLGKGFDESDFSTEMGRFCDKGALTREKEGSAYRYFVPSAK
ncbi:DNA-binding transcriptional regulator, XRE family [Parapedobacter composti]|uniref:DNA-binding transcriptional regulator, XRE family n=1 Tax=Parapedobacter composti TaxID=623281 RepID=A0A1I1FX30_9SPHI|nr:helix-turn-helix transcriptional regulator [Parapedobacter composti]SFC03831.1 DNA-binding transcriptional regulator, XRE family [Parapedobacter composti]